MSLHSRPVARLLFSLLALSLFASACGGSDAGDVDAALDAGDNAAVQDGAAGAADPLDDAAAGAEVTNPDTGDTPAEEAPVEEAPAEPTGPVDAATLGANTINIVRGLMNIDPNAEAVECMVAESGTDPNLLSALSNGSSDLFDIGEAEFRSLTLSMNGCLETLSLGDWATQAVGPQGDSLQTGPACFTAAFDDPESGDATFAAFMGMTYQRRMDNDALPGLIDTMTECAPITGLTDFFASQAEQANGFATLVNRECLNAALDSPEISREFWNVFVSVGAPPVDYIAPFTAQCSEEPPEVVDPNADLAAEVPADFVPWSGTGALAAVNPAARANVYSSPPPMTIDPTANYTAVISTGGSEIRIRLLADTAPITVNNFVSLARDGYYDRTGFHRVLDEFMAQGGDPTGSGAGGPGYQFQDEFDGGPALDRKGLLAMANAGPGTNGSQFFITFVPTEWLTGAHTVFGEVVEGIETVDAIQLRDPGSATPAQIIDSITIIEG